MGLADESVLNPFFSAFIVNYDSSSISLIELRCYLYVEFDTVAKGSFL
jgi:hypothetical protein